MGIAKKPYFMRRIDGQTALESSMRATCLALRQAHGFHEEGPTDGNGSWKSSDTTDSHVETPRRVARRNARDVEETGGDGARRFRRQHRQASEKRRTHPHRRPR